MTRTTGVFLAGAVSAIAVVSTAFVAGQARPEGSGPLHKYHITPGDIPAPTTGIGQPADGGRSSGRRTLNLPPGFTIDVFADEGQFRTLRYIIEGPDRRRIRGRCHGEHDHDPARHEQRRQG